ncbi:efflux RND transporter periplasmic adaptor subunit [Cupriavidus sp. UGS-1]|uniref:efflux RND transporter periplasmic adaptor subunit n=1 Tax=Cupriavidus sp. UGS-1 TaxID=2899826 RepID=UPI001E3B6515|nr:efflux RND transporter periplasmic adaptor subunit [Cupriavidus sp. UGS-1]MCD9122441.1 efflux RND transporter periplasmic adaptor subunit [Cupriavidus sp. UGS-1]
MAITSKQKAAIAAILAVGTLATAAVLLSGRAGMDTHDAHGDGHGHGGEQASTAAATPAATAAADKHADHDAPIALTDEQIQRAGITIETAGPATIQSGLQFPGEIRFNEDRTAHVVPRLAGVAESVPATLGERVTKGQLLAVIASTALSDQRSELLAAQRRMELASATYQRERKLWEEKISAEQDYLQAKAALEEARIAVQNAQQKLTAVGAKASSARLNQFELRAPFDGVIVEKHLALGEAVADNANIFTISDLSTVWAEFVVSARDLERVRVGETALIRSAASDGKAEGKVSYVGSLLGEQTRTAKARVTLKNPNLAWRPGLFVTVEVLTDKATVPVAVQADAVQDVDGNSVVFVAGPKGFVAQRVVPGRSDGQLVEIREGLRPGTRYAARNSFVLKSDLGKDAAGHQH